MDWKSTTNFPKDGQRHLATGGEPDLEHVKLIATGGHGEVHKVSSRVSCHTDRSIILIVEDAQYSDDDVLRVKGYPATWHENDRERY
jgi:hypothetical protein